jgi:hypothetical protein
LTSQNEANIDQFARTRRFKVCRAEVVGIDLDLEAVDPGRLASRDGL